MKSNFTKIKSMALAAIAFAGMHANAQVTLTKTLPPIGATYDWYVHLDPQPITPPDTSDNATWDYRAITTGLQFTKGGSSIIKTLAQVTEADKDSFPTASYVDEYIGGVAPYNTTGRYYYKDAGDVLLQLGSYIKLGTNPGSIVNISDSMFVFNTAYKAGWITKPQLLSTVPYSRRYVSYGTFKIRNETYNNAVLVRGEPVPNADHYYLVFTVQPYFSRIAIITILPDGKGTISYYQPTGSGSTGQAKLNINQNLTVYPNPANDVLHIKTNNLNGNIAAQISDLNGKIFNCNFTNSESIDVSDLKPGMYILKLQTEEGVTHQSFIKQ
jgi:hypothetical protein